MALLPAKTLQLSRSRPYKKNDNVWVEQRNWTHVRKQVGYRRFDTTAELATLNAFYACLRLYKNFFQPALKLKSKERVGGKIQRKYEPALTPTSDCLRPDNSVRRRRGNCESSMKV